MLLPGRSETRRAASPTVWMRCAQGEPEVFVGIESARVLDSTFEAIFLA